jgi:hypothetical protein
MNFILMKIFILFHQVTFDNLTKFQLNIFNSFLLKNLLSCVHTPGQLS